MNIWAVIIPTKIIEIETTKKVCTP